MEAAGFLEVRTLPDVTRIRERFATFCVAAVAAVRR